MDVLFLYFISLKHPIFINDQSSLFSDFRHIECVVKDNIIIVGQRNTASWLDSNMLTFFVAYTFLQDGTRIFRFIEELHHFLTAIYLLKKIRFSGKAITCQ